MSISLSIPKVSEPVRVNFKLPESIVSTFHLYVKAAKEIDPNYDESIVLEAILKNHFKRDKEFNKWLKNSEKSQIGDLEKKDSENENSVVSESKLMGINSDKKDLNGGKNSAVQ